MYTHKYMGKVYVEHLKIY